MTRQEAFAEAKKTAKEMKIPVYVCGINQQYWVYYFDVDPVRINGEKPAVFKVVP